MCRPFFFSVPLITALADPGSTPSALQPASPAGTQGSRPAGSATIDIPATGLTLEADLRALPTGPAAVLLLVSVLTLVVLALHPASDFHVWIADSCRDLRDLLRPLRSRRHVIHDRKYLQGVLRQEFQSRGPDHTKAGPGAEASASAAEPPPKARPLKRAGHRDHRSPSA